MLSNSQILKELKCICFDYIIKLKQMQLNKAIEEGIISEKLKSVVSSNYFRKETKAVIVYDLDDIQNRIQSLKGIFPNAFHAISVKANPLPAILSELNQEQLGLEVASSGELYIAMKSGFDAEKVVFDSPKKSILIWRI